MNNIRINKYLYFILLCTLFIGAHIVRANETFQNSLLKLDFYKSPSGGIKVTLYTSKPYNEPVSVNKKSDFEYVILLPETSNSMTANPILNAVADSVKAVNVRTQQYENQIKGYTKITIATSKPVEIIPQALTLKGSYYQLSENDYKELLAQTSKQTKAPVKKEVKQSLPSQVKKEVAKVVQTPKSAPAPLFNKSVASIEKPYISKLHSAPKPVVNAQITKKIKPRLPVVEHKTPIQQHVVTPSVVEKSVVSAPIEEPKVKTEVLTQPQIQPQAESQIQSSMPAPTQEAAPTPEVTQSLPTEGLLAPVQKVGRFEKYKKIIKNHLFVIVGLSSVIFILLLLGARKTIKNINKQKESFINHLGEKPSTVTDYTEKISEDMTWKEKFQTYRDATQEQNQQHETTMSSEEIFKDIDELDGLFGSEPKVETKQDFSKEEPAIENIIPEVEIQQNEDESTLGELDELQSYGGETENVSIDELFGEEEPILKAQQEGPIRFEQPVIEENFETEEQDEIIKSEFAIDNEKGFYLVDFEDSTALVGHIEDEIFILKRFKKRIEGTLQARLDERKNNSVNYMTKVGNYRALVEVTPNNMNLLIEL